MVEVPPEIVEKAASQNKVVQLHPLNTTHYVYCVIVKRGRKSKVWWLLHLLLRTRMNESVVNCYSFHNSSKKWETCSKFSENKSRCKSYKMSGTE